MKKVILKSIELNNFKGLEHKHVTFDNGVTNLYGTNEVGKTTLVDSWLWLMTDKNSEGDTQFGVNNTKNLFSTAEVKAVLEIDGVAHTLEKHKIQKKDKNGVLSGTENKYFINELKNTMSNFNAWVKENIGDLEKIKLISDPLYFNSLDPKVKRKVLVELVGEVKKEDVLKEIEPTKEFIAELEKYTIDQLKQVCVESISKNKKELSENEIRISENNHILESEIAVEIDQQEVERLEKLIEETTQKGLALKNGVETQNIDLEIAKIKHEKDKLVIPSLKPAEVDTTKLKELEIKKSNLELKNNDLKKTKEEIDNSINTFTRKKAEFFEKYDLEKAKVFDEASVKCSSCGQDLTPEAQEKLRTTFEKEKAQNINTFGLEIKGIAGEIESKKETLNTTIEELAKTEEQLKSVVNELEVEKQEIETKKSNLNVESEFVYNKEKQAYDNKVSELDSEIAKLEERKLSISKDIEPELAKLREDLSGYKKELDVINENKSKAKNLEDKANRIADLEEKNGMIIKDLDLKESLLQECNKYIKEMVRMLDEKINTKFEMARFKLFNINFNGNLEECCITQYKGVNYKDVNNAGKINVGLDILGTLSETNNLSLPIFIDNAEANVNILLREGQQQIRLYVDEYSSELVNQDQKDINDKIRWAKEIEEIEGE